MANLKARAIIIGVALGLLLGQGVAAVIVTEEPSVITRGDHVTLGIRGLENGSSFSFKISGAFAVTPGSDFSFEIRNFSMPFSLKNSNISAMLRDTQSNVLSVKKGDTEVRKAGNSRSGVFSANQTMNITNGTYDHLSLEGVAASGAQFVTADLSLTGTKEGPDDSAITFYLDGINDGTVQFTVLVNGGVALSKTVVLGNPVNPGGVGSSSGTGSGTSGAEVTGEVTGSGQGQESSPGSPGASSGSSQAKANTGINTSGTTPTKAGTGVITLITGILAVFWCIKRLGS